MLHAHGGNCCVVPTLARHRVTNNIGVRNLCTHLAFERKSRRSAIAPVCGSVTVVGGGAAGLTAAYFAALGGAEVTVLERNAEAGRKILISGGTRSNVLPMEVDIARDFFTESSSAAMRGVFATWSLPECKDWLEHDLGLKLASEAATKKWFPASNDAREVRDRLVSACREKGVQIRYSASLESLKHVGSPAAEQSESSSRSSSTATTSGSPASHSIPSDRESSGNTSQDSNSSSSSRRSRGSEGGEERQDDSAVGSSGGRGWVCGLQDGTQVQTQRLILAAGGLSFPGLGTDGTVHRLVAGLGHKLAPPYPALTPLLGGHPGGAQLAGLSLYDVQLQVRAAKKQKKAAAALRQAFLFTHRGYSGPAVLDLSHHAVMALDRHTPPPALRVSWTGEDADAWQQRFAFSGAAAIGAIMKRHGIPARLADALAAEAGAAPDCQVAQLKRGQQDALVKLLSAYELPVNGHQGYAKAEVTGGGIRLAEVNCGSMESRHLPGVHIAGELLDVFGRIGGFNFYWAWISGRLAGMGAAAAVKGL